MNLIGRCGFVYIDGQSVYDLVTVVTSAIARGQGYCHHENQHLYASADSVRIFWPSRQKPNAKWTVGQMLCSDISAIGTGLATCIERFFLLSARQVRCHRSVAVVITK